MVSNNPYTLKYIIEYLINEYITIDVIMITLMLIIALIFISHIKLKTLIFISIFFLFFAFSFLLIYDITYINYMLSLHLDNTIRIFIGTRLPTFSLGNHAPSKALPRLELSLLTIIHVKWQQFFIVKEAYKYVKLVQERKLFLSRIYILILTLPKHSYILKQSKKIKCHQDFFKSIFDINHFIIKGDKSYA